MPEMLAVGTKRADVNDEATCPRCGVRILPLGYSGALSRADNATEVCARCGTLEALSDWAGGTAGHEADPEVDWPYMDGEM